MTGGPFPQDAERCFPVCARHPAASGYQFKGDEMWCSGCWSEAHKSAWTRTPPTGTGWYWVSATGCSPYTARVSDGFVWSEYATRPVGWYEGYWWLGPLPVPAPPAVEGAAE